MVLPDHEEDDTFPAPANRLRVQNTNLDNAVTQVLGNEDEEEFQATMVLPEEDEFPTSVSRGTLKPTNANMDNLQTQVIGNEEEEELIQATLVLPEGHDDDFAIPQNRTRLNTRNNDLDNATTQVLGDEGMDEEIQATMVLADRDENEDDHAYTSGNNRLGSGKNSYDNTLTQVLGNNRGSNLRSGLPMPKIVITKPSSNSNVNMDIQATMVLNDQEDYQAPPPRRNVNRMSNEDLDNATTQLVGNEDNEEYQSTMMLPDNEIEAPQPRNKRNQLSKEELDNAATQVVGEGDEMDQETDFQATMILSDRDADLPAPTNARKMTPHELANAPTLIANDNEEEDEPVNQHNLRVDNLRTGAGSRSPSRQGLNSPSLPSPNRQNVLLTATVPDDAGSRSPSRQGQNSPALLSPRRNAMLTATVPDDEEDHTRRLPISPRSKEALAMQSTLPDDDISQGNQDEGSGQHQRKEAERGRRAFATLSALSVTQNTQADDLTDLFDSRETFQRKPVFSGENSQNSSNFLRAARVPSKNESEEKKSPASKSLPNQANETNTTRAAPIATSRRAPVTQTIPQTSQESQASQDLEGPETVSPARANVQASQETQETSTQGQSLASLQARLREKKDAKKDTKKKEAPKVEEEPKRVRVSTRGKQTNEEEKNEAVSQDTEVEKMDIEEPKEEKGARGRKKVEKQAVAEAPKQQRNTRASGANKKEEEEAEKAEEEKLGRGARTRGQAKKNDEASEDKKEKDKEETSAVTKKAGKTATKAQNKANKKNDAQKDEEDEKDEEEKRENAQTVNTRGRGRRSSEQPSLEEDEQAATTSKKIKSDKEPPKTGPANKKAAAGRGEEVKKEEAEEIDMTRRHAYQATFSGFEKNDNDAEGTKKALAGLGVKLVEEKEKNFNVLVMDKFKRTIKFLLAINKGVDIVSYKWAQECIKQGKIVPPGDYIYFDKAAETKYKFKLADTIRIAKNKKSSFLEGHRVYIPNNIKPSHEEIKLIIESADGVFVKAKPSAAKDADVIVILNEDDAKTIKQFKDQGFKPYSTELLFSGVLQQTLNLKQNML